MIGDSTYDTLDWHDHLLSAGVVPIAPYNPRNTDDPLDIEYRVEDRIEKHSEDVQLKHSVLDETYNRRTQIERMMQSKTAASGPFVPEAASTHGYRYSLHCASEWSSQSPPTNEETIRAARFSWHETDSMTRSPLPISIGLLPGESFIPFW